MNEPKVSSEKSLRIPVQGTSMCPTLQPGDICQVQVMPAPFGSGDIIVFWAGKGLVVHRVLLRVKEQVVTRGDNQTWIDRPIPLSRVLGVVVTAQRAGTPIVLHNRGMARALYPFFTWIRVLWYKVRMRLQLLPVSHFQGWEEHCGRD